MFTSRSVRSFWPCSDVATEIYGAESTDRWAVDSEPDLDLDLDLDLGLGLDPDLDLNKPQRRP